MASLTSAQRVFMFLWIIGSVDAGVLEAKPGEDVTLQCHSQTDVAVSKLVWSRLGLKDINVLFFRDNRLNENQDQSYHGRVELKDPQMKNGNFSVVLKSVTVNDTGGYQCRVTPPDKPTELVCSVHLSVSEGRTKEQLRKQSEKDQIVITGLGVGLGLVCPLVGVAGFALGRFVFPKPKSGPL